MPGNVIEVIIRAKTEGQAALQGFKNDLTSANKAILGMTAVSAGIAVAMGAAASGMARDAEETKALASATGQSTESLTRMKFAAEQSETTLDAYRLGMRFLQKNQTDAIQGNDRTATSFRRVGISVQDLRTLSPEALFLKFADGLTKVDGAAERTRLRIALLGRGGNQLAPLLAAGTDEIKRMQAESDRLGYTLTKAQVVLGDEMGDAAKAAGAALIGLRNAVATAVAPTIKAYTDDLKEAVVGVKNFTDAHKPLVAAIFLSSARFAAIGGVVQLAGIAFMGASAAVTLFGAAVKTAMGWVGIAIIAIQGVLFVLDYLKAKSKEKYVITLEFATKGMQEAKGTLLQWEQIQRTENEKMGKLQRDLATLEAKPAPPMARQPTSRDTFQTPKEVLQGATAQEIAAKRAEIAKLNATMGDTTEQIKRVNEIVKMFTDAEGAAGVDADKTTEKIKTLGEAVGSALNEEATAEAKRYGSAVESILKGVGRTADDLHKEAEKALADMKPVPIDDPFVEARGGLEQFLEGMGLTIGEIRQFGKELVLAGKDADSLWAGAKAGIEGIRAQFKMGGMLDPAVSLAQDAVMVVQNFASGAATAIGQVLTRLSISGKNIVDVMKSLFRALGQVVKQLIADIITAIAKAAILAGLKAIFLSGGGTAPSTGGGGRTLRSGGTIPQAVVGLLTGGSVSGRAPAFTQAIRAVGGLTVVPGLPLKRDIIPAYLAPGEVVLSSVGGRTPTAVLAGWMNATSALVDQVKRRDQAPASRSVTFQVQTYNAASFRRDLRRGELRRELDIIADLTRGRS